MSMSGVCMLAVAGSNGRGRRDVCASGLIECNTGAGVIEVKLVDSRDWDMEREDSSGRLSLD